MKVTDTTCKKNDRKGAALLVVLMLSSLGAIAVGSVLWSSVSQARISERQICLEQAFFVATAGAEDAAAVIGTGRATTSKINGTCGRGSYSVDVERTVASNGEILFNITSDGTVGDVTRRVVIKGIRRVSWAKYALWYDDEKLDLWITPGERFDGRVYSKPLMRFHDQDLATKGQTLFKDRVWTVPTYIKKQSNKVDPIFEQGIVMGADPEDMASVDFAELLATNSYGGLTLEGETSITFSGASLLITNSRTNWNNKVVNIPANGMIYVKSYKLGRTTYPGTVKINGVNGLQGQLTIVAEQDIEILNHVRYKTNPKTNPNSTDALGLIAKKDVVVTKAAPNNLDIFAHIIAQEGGFGVFEYNKGAGRGMLNVYGGIVNKYRNAVGLVGSSGYNKNYIFDRRFSVNPPPNYPKVPDDLEWTEWEG